MPQDQLPAQSASKYNRVLIGFEALGLQGFPTEWICEAEDCSTTDPQLFDLGGNAFPGTVIAAIYVAVLVHVDFSSVESVNGVSDKQADISELAGLLTF